MTVFYESVKKKVDKIAAYCFAWEKVMGRPQFHLLCSWHVDTAWQGKLQGTKAVEKRDTIYSMLKICQRETAKSRFLVMFKSSIDDYDERVSGDSEIDNGLSTLKTKKRAGL